MIVKEYVGGLGNADELLDMISAAADGEEAKATKGDMIYPEYYSISRMMTGIKAGTLHQGTFNISPYNFLEVLLPNFPRLVLVLKEITGLCSQSILR